MKQTFSGWEQVANSLCRKADEQQAISVTEEEKAARLNHGQRASLRGIADRIISNGVVIADEVGMGKTRIAVHLAKSVVECGGRVAILVPPGLGYQWRTELKESGLENVPPILRSLRAYLGAWDEDHPSRGSKNLRLSFLISSRIGDRVKLPIRGDGQLFRSFIATGSLERAPVYRQVIVEKSLGLALGIAGLLPKVSSMRF